MSPPPLSPTPNDIVCSLIASTLVLAPRPRLARGPPRAMACESLQVGEAPSVGCLRVGTWNMSHWTVDRAGSIAQDIPVDVLAIQETHLAPLPLEWARTSAASLGLHLHHGRPAAPVGAPPHGKSCGVGFAATTGLALMPLLPQGASWRMLHAMRRLSAVQLPPRPGLPRGLTLISIYAPLLTQPIERERFVLAMLQLTHGLDMQTPTLLLGDFNGTLPFSNDATSSNRPANHPICPLLAALLGPGRAWLDVLATLLTPPPCPALSRSPPLGLVLPLHALTSSWPTGPLWPW